MTGLTQRGRLNLKMLDHLAILVPCAERVAIHVRRYANPGLHFVKYGEGLDALYDVIYELPTPRMIVFVGSQYHGYLAPLLSEDTALCIIPGAWMRHLPPLEDVVRARFAVQLLEAQASEPIQLLCPEQDLPV
jgi:hypothetical protein